MLADTYLILYFGKKSVFNVSFILHAYHNQVETHDKMREKL